MCWLLTSCPFQTLLRNNVNPLTRQPFGEDFLYTGYIDVSGSLNIFVHLHDVRVSTQVWLLKIIAKLHRFDNISKSFLTAYLVPLRDIWWMHRLWEQRLLPSGTRRRCRHSHKPRRFGTTSLTRPIQLQVSQWQSHNLNFATVCIILYLEYRELYSFRYGRAEVRAKMPVGDWLWPGKCKL